MSREERQQLRTRLDSEDFPLSYPSLTGSQILERPGSLLPRDAVINLAGLEVMRRHAGGRVAPKGVREIIGLEMGRVLEPNPSIWMWRRQNCFHMGAFIQS